MYSPCIRHTRDATLFVCFKQRFLKTSCLEDIDVQEGTLEPPGSQTSSALGPWTHRSATANTTGSEIHAVCGYCRSLTAFSNSICTFALGCLADATFRGDAVVDDLGFWAGPRDVRPNARGVPKNGGELVTLGPLTPPASSSLSCPSCPSSLSSWTAWSEYGYAHGVLLGQHWTASVTPVQHPLAQWNSSTLEKVHFYCWDPLEAATLSKTCAEKSDMIFWWSRFFLGKSCIHYRTWRMASMWKSALCILCFVSNSERMSDGSPRRTSTSHDTPHGNIMSPRRTSNIIPYIDTPRRNI